MEEQIRAIIGLPVLWRRHVRHLDSGLCSNAHAAPPSMPSQQSHIASPCKLCQKIFQASNNLKTYKSPCKLCKKIFSSFGNMKTHMRANHSCDWFQISEMETRSTLTFPSTSRKFVFEILWLGSWNYYECIFSANVIVSVFTKSVVFLWASHPILHREIFAISLLSNYWPCACTILYHRMYKTF